MKFKVGDIIQDIKYPNMIGEITEIKSETMGNMVDKKFNLIYFKQDTNGEEKATFAENIEYEVNYAKKLKRNEIIDNLLND